MSIEGAARSDIIDYHLRSMWVGIDRPAAMHREGWTGNKLSNSGAPFAWFDFHAEPHAFGTPIVLRRMWWDARKLPRRTEALIAAKIAATASEGLFA